MPNNIGSIDGYRPAEDFKQLTHNFAARESWFVSGFWDKASYYELRDRGDL